VLVVYKDDIKVKSTGFIYRVLIEENSLLTLGKTMRLLFPAQKALLVSDNKVFSLYGESVVKALVSEKWQVKSVQIKPGEQSKTLNQASRLYDAALEAGLDRNSPVVALGGGVVGDLAGFVAATFLRGVPLVMVPTTLLAQVDSSVGGKVAVNHPRGKNLIGAIYPPRVVVIDPLVLCSLSDRQLLAGLAEVIKYGIIKDLDFFCWLEENLDHLIAGDNERLAQAITISVRTKAEVVEKDEYEKDQRRILNYGHTLGHALEAATGYRYYLHGEAVLIGMLAATELAVALSVLDTSSADRIRQLLSRISYKKPPAGLTAERVIDKLRQDKKRLNEDNFFILPQEIGSTKVIAVKEEQLLNKVVNNYLTGTGYFISGR
jgi:3-dehydroquinate synthase